jgi:hypothetical protein
MSNDTDDLVVVLALGEDPSRYVLEGSVRKAGHAGDPRPLTSQAPDSLERPETPET